MSMEFLVIRQKDGTVWSDDLTLEMVDICQATYSIDITLMKCRNDIDYGDVHFQLLRFIMTADNIIYIHSTFLKY